MLDIARIIQTRKGVTPPSIVGYKEKDGHNTSKIMRVLNAFYLCKTDGTKS